MANQGCLGFLFNLFGRGGAAVPAPPPYQLRNDALLTERELKFYGALRLAVGNTYTICPKIRLADIFEVRPFSQAYHNKIDRKHVDFLLCDPVTLRPIAGVELDDSTHQRADAQKRDADKDAAFRAGGLPLIRIPARGSYNPHEIRSMLQQVSAPGITYEKAAPREKASSGPVTPTPIVGGRKPTK